MPPYKIKDEELIQVKRFIENQQAPLFFENEYGKFCLVITETAKRKFLNKGFVAITINELRNWIKDCKSFKQQQKVVLGKCKDLEERFETANQVKEIFKGEIKYIKPL